MVGTPSGKLVQYTPEGEAKAEVPPPPELDPSVQYYPSFVRWLENDLFLTAYAQANGEPSDLLEMFVIHRQGAAFTFTKFFDPLDTMGVTGRSGTYRYFAGLRDWGAKTKHLSFVMSGLASEIAVMHGQPAGKGEVSKWEVLILDETARGIMPAAKKGVSDETSCLGLSLDLTSDKGIRQGIQGGIEQPDLPPAPRLLAYSQEGLILAFDVLYPDAGRYEGMVKPGEVEDVRTEQAMNSTNEVSSLRTASFGSNPFGLSTSPSTPVKHPTAFGGSAFGQSTTPAFGSSSKPAAFGASAFGQSSVPASTSPNTAPSALANTKPAAFGQSAFGQSRTPAAFRAQSFGKPASAGFGSPSSPFAESSSSGSSGFGQFAKPATASAFGSSSITSTGLGFGAFGAKPASATTGFGFGASAFGQPARPAATPSTQGPSQASPFGSGGMVSAFGSSSGFGQSAIGTKPAPNSGPSQSSAFAGFGSPSQFQNAANLNAGTASSPSPLAQTDSGDSGLGGFSSALDTSNAALPGLDDSPPTSPVGISGRLGGMDDDSPPNSPPLQPVPMTSGQRPQAVSSAFIKPATAFGGASSSGTFGQSANKTTSAFLPGSTPAAFASPASSTTSAPTSAPAFGQQSPMTPTSSSGSAFGQPSVPIAFGKPTAPTSPAAGFANITGGFGSFAAKPASPSTDAVPKPRGFGGFGGFAAAGVSAFGEKRVENAFLSMLSEGTEPTEATKSPLASPFSAPQVTTTSVPEVTKPPAEPVKPASPPFLESIVSEKSQLETPSKPGEPPNRPVETSSTPASIPSATSSATILPIPDDEPEVEEPVSEDEADHSGSATEIVDDERDYSQEELTDEHEDEDEEGYEGESDHRDQEQRRQSCVVRSPSDEYVPDETRSNTTESGKDEDTPTTRAKFPSTEISHPEGMAPTTDDTVSKGPAAISAPEPSLLSRLGPPAPAQAAFSASPVPEFPAFNLKHAARTSSPLSVHPPETLVDSTTPPASPAGKPQSASSVANLFTPVVKKEVKSISPVPNAQPAPAEASNPGAGLGLGRPPSAPPKASTPPVADMKPSSSLPFSFAKPSGNPLPSSPAAPSFIAAKPPAASPQAGVDEAAKPPSTFAVPARPTVSAAPSRRERANKSMVVVLERMITDLLADVQNASAW